MHTGHFGGRRRMGSVARGAVAGPCRCVCMGRGHGFGLVAFAAFFFGFELFKLHHDAMQLAFFTGHVFQVDGG
jgi:hypothetical protein